MPHHVEIRSSSAWSCDGEWALAKPETLDTLRPAFKLSNVLAREGIPPWGRFESSLQMGG